MIGVVEQKKAERMVGGRTRSGRVEQERRGDVCTDTGGVSDV